MKIKETNKQIKKYAIKEIYMNFRNQIGQEWIQSCALENKRSDNIKNNSTKAGKNH